MYASMRIRAARRREPAGVATRRPLGGDRTPLPQWAAAGAVDVEALAANSNPMTATGVGLRELAAAAAEQRQQHTEAAASSHQPPAAAGDQQRQGGGEGSGEAAAPSA